MVGSAQDIRNRTTKFVELLTSHQRKLHSYISMLLLGDSAAADVLQDTNLDLWAHADEFDFDRAFLPWAFAFARQRVMAFRKSRMRSRVVFTDEAIVQFEEHCQHYAEEADARLVALQKCLQKLHPQQAELIRERYASMSSVRMMAARLSDSEHNISCRLHRIRKSLARCIHAALAVEQRLAEGR
jgi:RNA polymerase sigma-70 factor (ECF subfamily)